MTEAINPEEIREMRVRRFRSGDATNYETYREVEQLLKEKNT